MEVSPTLKIEAAGSLETLVTVYMPSHLKTHNMQSEFQIPKIYCNAYHNMQLRYFLLDIGHHQFQTQAPANVKTFPMNFRFSPCIF